MQLLSYYITPNCGGYRWQKPILSQFKSKVHRKSRCGAGLGLIEAKGSTSTSPQAWKHGHQLFLVFPQQLLLENLGEGHGLI